MVQTLAWIHAAGLSHRDLKPSNVLIDADGMPVVADFEISRDDAHVASFATTTIGRAAGTPPWMAPEVLGRRSKGDMRADMWALGVMLADTLAGCGFAAQGDAAVIYTTQDRGALVPDAPTAPGAPSRAMLCMVREVLSIEPLDRPTAAEILRRPGVFVAVSSPADLCAVTAGPAQRRSALDTALRTVQTRGRRHRLRSTVQRSDVLPALVAEVNGMSSRQLSMDWEAAFADEVAQDYGGVHMELLTCAFDACRERLLCREDDDAAGAYVFRADRGSAEDEAAAECMGRLMLHSLVHGIAPPLSLNPAMYACALGSPLATPTDFNAHDFEWWRSSTGDGATASRGWVGWAEPRYEVHLRWLDAADPSGLSRRRLDPHALVAAGCLSFEDEGLCAGEQLVDSVDVARWYVLMKLHKRFFGGALAKMCRAFGRGLCALGDEVFAALAALLANELLPRVEGQQYMNAELLLRLMEFQNHRDSEDEWFKAAVRALQTDELPMLLRFVTGVARLDGGGALPPMRGRQQGTIEVRFGGGATFWIPDGRN